MDHLVFNLLAGQRLYFICEKLLTWTISYCPYHIVQIILSISYCPDHIVLVVIIASIYHIYIFLFIYRLNSGIFRIFAHIYETFHMIWTISYIHIMVHMLWTNRFSWRKRDTEDRLSKPYSSPDMIKWTWRGHFLQSTIWLKYLTSL